MPFLSMPLIREMAVPAFLISIVGFVESVSVGRTLAAKRRQRIDPDQELIGLGAANIASSFSSGYPVTGGFARSVVNFDAGAETPAAGAFTAIGLALATMYLTPLLAYLPQATLAATIIVAVLSLVDFSILKKTWNYAKSDFAAVTATIILTLVEGVEIGIVVGVVLSIFFHLFKSSRPHIAVLGRVPGTEHFRNIKRHSVETDASILSMRVDESLYFANARYLEDQINAHLANQPAIRHLILNCPAVNDIDISALESLEAINTQLKDAGVSLHLSEVKGPVMDKLERSGFLPHLTGKVFLSHHRAVSELQEGSSAQPVLLPI
jgi:sulfate permease, SulP family